MSDIVERLRSHDDCLLQPIRRDVKEAADEIERLRAEVQRQTRHVEQLYDQIRRRADERDKAQIEVERLRADNERLREALRWYADQENHFPVHAHHRRAGYPDPVAVFIKEPQIMDDCGRRARAALEGKP